MGRGYHPPIPPSQHIWLDHKKSGMKLELTIIIIIIIIIIIPGAGAAGNSSPVADRVLGGCQKASGIKRGGGL